MSKLSNNRPTTTFNWLLLSLCLIALTWMACPFDTEPAAINSKQPKLFIVGADMSESFKYERLTPQYIRSFCQTVAKSDAAAAICIYPIGNPSNEFFLQCELDEIPPLDENGLLSQQAEQAKERKRIRALREKAIETFIAEYTETIAKHSMDLQTDFQGFLDKSLLLIKSDFPEHQASIFIFSDALNDVKGNTKINLPSEEELIGIEWHGCGLQNQALIKALNIKVYESPNGYLKSITNHLSKKEGQ